jgi:hypothetical protein
MIGTIGHWKVYDDLTFNCPKCFLVHFEKDWRKKWVKDMQEFPIICINPECQKWLVVIVKDNFVLVTTSELNTFIKKTNRAMKKNINVAMHLKKYADISPECKVLMIKGLQEMLEEDRQQEIKDLEAKLESLKSGVYPPVSNEEQENTSEATIVTDEQDLPFIEPAPPINDQPVNSDDL